LNKTKQLAVNSQQNDIADLKKPISISHQLLTEKNQNRNVSENIIVFTLTNPSILTGHWSDESVGHCSIERNGSSPDCSLLNGPPVTLTSSPKLPTRFYVSELSDWASSCL